MTIENGVLIDGVGTSTARRFMEVSNPFWDIRCQDLLDSGPNGYHLAANVGVMPYRQSPFGLGKCLDANGSTSLKLSNPAHDALFQAFCLRTSWTMFFAVANKEAGLAATDRGPIFFCGGDVTSAVAANNIGFHIAVGDVNDIEYGGHSGVYVPGFETSENLPIHGTSVFAITKEPGTAGNVIYTYHNLNGTTEVGAEHPEPDGGASAVVSIARYVGITDTLDSYLQQMLFTEDRIEDSSVTSILGMIA